MLSSTQTQSVGVEAEDGDILCLDCAQSGDIAIVPRCSNHETMACSLCHPDGVAGYREVIQYTIEERHSEDGLVCAACDHVFAEPYEEAEDDCNN